MSLPTFLIIGNKSGNTNQKMSRVTASGNASIQQGQNSMFNYR